MLKNIRLGVPIILFSGMEKWQCVIIMSPGGEGEWVANTVLDGGGEVIGSGADRLVCV